MPMSLCGMKFSDFMVLSNLIQVHLTLSSSTGLWCCGFYSIGWIYISPDICFRPVDGGLTRQYQSHSTRVQVHCTTTLTSWQRCDRRVALPNTWPRPTSHNLRCFYYELASSNVTNRWDPSNTGHKSCLQWIYSGWAFDVSWLSIRVYV